MRELAEKLELGLYIVTEHKTEDVPNKAFDLRRIHHELNVLKRMFEREEHQYSKEQLMFEHIKQVHYSAFRKKLRSMPEAGQPETFYPVSDCEEIFVCTDFMLHGHCGLYRTVTRDKSIPKPTNLSKPTYWHAQAAMMYSNSLAALVVYESRESGKTKVIHVKPNESVQYFIKQKVKALHEYLLTQKALA